jgi:hypothetical protein
MTRSDQFAYIEAARANLLRWAPEHGIPLHRIEFVVPSVDTDLGLSAWFFFETDEQLRRSKAMGWPQRLSTRFTEVVVGLGCPATWLPEIRFVLDSHENIIRNYEGSYIYRLR